ncbi:hypothetical protein BROUX41_006353 [Berkeleyomyces rouxiae]|uniref:uncharacterized protein n=1 Tax=Berkeleyomyces rouxiae TaxID=2035830 RepID=UPI003B81A0B7
MSSSAPSAKLSAASRPPPLSDAAVKPAKAQAPASATTSATASSSSTSASTSTSTPAALHAGSRRPTATMEYGLNSPGMDMAMRRQHQFSADGMTMDADYAHCVNDHTWNPYSLPDPFNRPDVPPLRSITLSADQEAEYARVLEEAKARARELDARNDKK